MILALSGVLLQNLTRVMIYVNFEINREYIAKNLCINRDEPITVCGGKCYLQKQLEDQARKEQSNPLQNIQAGRDVLLFLQHPPVYQFFKTMVTEKKYAPYLVWRAISVISPVFRPPIDQSF